MMGDVMTTDRIDAIEVLLLQAEAAHGVYETTELNGAYDEAWDAWYADYAVGHGLGDLLGRPVASDELGRFLASTFAEFKTADPKPTEPWAAYTARRIATEL
jgi:hypothetical protein